MMTEWAEKSGHCLLERYGMSEIGAPFFFFIFFSFSCAFTGLRVEGFACDSAIRV